MPLEKEVKQSILDYLNSLPKCYARGKHSSPFSKGWPDIQGCLRGRTLAFEVKQPKSARDPRPKKEATVLHEMEQLKWCRAGAVVGVVTSVDAVKAILSTYDLLPASGGDAPTGRG